MLESSDQGRLSVFSSMVTDRLILSSKHTAVVVLSLSLLSLSLSGWLEILILLGGNMLMFHVDVNIKRLGVRFKNDSLQ